MLNVISMPIVISKKLRSLWRNKKEPMKRLNRVIMEVYGVHHISISDSQEYEHRWRVSI